MSFGAFVQGVAQGVNFVQDLEDRRQQGQLRQFEIEKAKRALEQQKQDDEINKEAAEAVRRSLERGVSPTPAGDAGQQESDAAVPGTAAPQPTAQDIAAQAGANVQQPVAQSPGVQVFPVPDRTPADVTSPSETAQKFAAENGATPPPYAGLPAGKAGPGQMSPSIIEAAGKTQPAPEPPPAAGSMPTATMPRVVIGPKDVKKTESFHEARIRLALERGNGELAGKYMQEYSKFLVDESTVAEKKFEKEQRPLLEEMAKIRTREEWNALPLETRVRMVQTYGDVSDKIARNVVLGWQLVQNPLTRKDGMLLLARAFGEDDPLKDILVDGDFYIPIGADGKQLVGHDGKPVRIHKDAIERMMKQFGQKDQLLVLKKGDQLFNPNSGKVVAENTNGSQTNQRQVDEMSREIMRVLDKLLGAGGSLGTSVLSKEARDEYERLLREATILRQNGKAGSAVEAVEMAMNTVRGRQASGNVNATVTLPPSYKPPWK